MRTFAAASSTELHARHTAARAAAKARQAAATAAAAELDGAAAVARKQCTVALANYLAAVVPMEAGATGGERSAVALLVRPPVPCGRKLCCAAAVLSVLTSLLRLPVHICRCSLDSPSTDCVALLLARL